MKDSLRKPGVWVLLLLVGLVLIPASSRAQESDAYTNAVSEGTVDTFPDPATIKGKDGFWYSYGTTNPVFQSRGEDGERYVPIMRSDDLVNWEYAGQVFDSPSDFPEWFGEDARLWAPDIRYIDGEYHLYYSVAGGGGGIGVVTAPTPTGPWTDSGGTVVPRGTQDCPTGDIDQAQFTDTDGKHYLYWGSYDVVCVAEMNEDATRIVGEPEEVLLARRGEGPFVVRHDDFYYLFYSEAGCCEGAFSGYQVKVGRSKSPMGPFVDEQGTPLTAPEPKESFVLAANGNRWIGPGHHGFFTDLSGQDWFSYHAIPEEDPDLDPVSTLPDRRLSKRPLLIDRLDWIDGWPTVRAGEWASDDAQQAPVADWSAGSTFNDENALEGWSREGAARGAWRVQREQDSLGYVRQQAPAGREAYLVSEQEAPANVRAEADLRLPNDPAGKAGLVAAYRDSRNHIVAWLDPAENALVTDAVVDGRSTGRETTPLPENFTFDEWHNVAVEIRGRDMSVEVTSDRLADPLAIQERELPAGATGPGSVGVVSLKARPDADNVGASPLYEPVTEKVPDPEVGALDPASSDEFDDGTLDPAWSWVRNPEGSETGGSYVWPTRNEELTGGTNNASVLVREAPEGDYTVETKLRFSPDTFAQQAGLVLYGGDDDYVKLVHLPVRRNPSYETGLMQYTEFAKEGPRPSTGAAAYYAPTYVGPTADEMYLRLQHTFDPEEGEHDIRAATSTDGERWVWGGVWSVPAELDLDIGLVSMNQSGATAEFDYVRTYRP